MADATNTPKMGECNRVCPACGTPIVWREDDYPSTFAKRKYCSNHCARISARKRDPLDRFVGKVDKTPGHGPNGDCHLWTGRKGSHGYGGFDWNGTMLAHRASYMLFRGDIPDGMMVCHSCDNPPCVNPAHLFIGTHDDNMKDMAAKGRAQPQFGERHTHAELTEQNVRDILVDPRSNAELGRVYGVTRATIRFIRIGRTWKHVPRPKAA